MTELVGGLLERRAREALVGRQEELASLRACLTHDGPLVSCLHGIAGMGKTTLLNAFLAEAAAGGAAVVRLDCRTFEPTPAGFLRELARAVGSDAADLSVISRRLGEYGSRVVLALDTYEVLRLIDDWMRVEFVPRLTANVRVILSGRDLPFFAWETAPGWHGFFRSIPLGPLLPNDADELLRRDGVDPALASRLNRLVRGHPLGLVVAASAARGRSDFDIEGLALRGVLDVLARAYLDDLDPLTRQALDAASVVRRMTVSLVTTMLPEAPPEESLERLRRLPFVEVMRDGLVTHDTMQQAIGGILRATDPDRYRRLKGAAWRQLRAEAAGAGREDLWRYTADMLFMIEKPMPREAFFPSDKTPYAVEQARPSDEPAILEILQRHLGEKDAAAWQRWWERMPEAFRAVRERSGALVGFTLFFDPARVPRRWLTDDPVSAAFVEHLDRQPVGNQARALVYRGWLDRERGEAMGGVQAACWLDVKRTYMELRPHLQRVYAGVYDLATYGPVLLPLRFQPLPSGPLALDGSSYTPAVLEFGPGSVDAWLAWLVGSELGIKDDVRATRGPLESATLTFLFSDIVGSTALLQQLGEEKARPLFERHHRLLSRAVANHGGEELEWLGDGMLAAFGSSVAAVRCALDMQRATRRPLSGQALHLRVGLHTGEAMRRDGGYFGNSIVLARRLCDRAQAGQVLTSGFVASMLAGRHSFAFRELGTARLKGIEQEVALFEAVTSSARAAMRGAAAVAG